VHHFHVLEVRRPACCVPPQPPPASWTPQIQARRSVCRTNCCSAHFSFLKAASALVPPKADWHFLSKSRGLGGQQGLAPCTSCGLSVRQYCRSCRHVQCHRGWNRSRIPPNERTSGRMRASARGLSRSWSGRPHSELSPIESLIIRFRSRGNYAEGRDPTSGSELSFNHEN
jgi:hypothetical protein